MKFDVFGLPIANPSSSSSSSFTDEEKNRLEILQPKGKPRPPQPAYDPYHRMNMDRLKSTLVSIKKIDVDVTSPIRGRTYRIVLITYFYTLIRLNG
uniref:Uncharacterized protein n=1 Tax=Trichogramma kaykai TaxID=54128 RepID=A0ABD2X8I1_9HYME